MFEEFWVAYPRKVAKSVARKAWAKLTEEQQLSAAKAIFNHCQYWKAKETALEFIPHPATWINQERWEDELVIEPNKRKETTLGTDKQIEEAYRIECGGDPAKARFNSYFEMKKYVLDQREKRAKAQT
jgi:hypothetical protein